jgi:2-isopropylmalate synthase
VCFDVQVIDRAVDAVCYLRSLGCEDIEFTAEDASRSDPDFVCEVVQHVIKAGATTIMIPDTVGWQLSPEYSKLIAHIKVGELGQQYFVGRSTSSACSSSTICRWLLVWA